MSSGLQSYCLQPINDFQRLSSSSWDCSSVLCCPNMPSKGRREPTSWELSQARLNTVHTVVPSYFAPLCPPSPYSRRASHHVGPPSSPRCVGMLESLRQPFPSSAPIKHRSFSRSNSRFYLSKGIPNPFDWRAHSSVFSQNCKFNFCHYSHSLIFQLLVLMLSQLNLLSWGTRPQSSLSL